MWRLAVAVVSMTAICRRRLANIGYSVALSRIMPAILHPHTNYCVCGLCRIVAMWLTAVAAANRWPLVAAAASAFSVMCGGIRQWPSNVAIAPCGIGCMRCGLVALALIIASGVAVWPWRIMS